MRDRTEDYDYARLVEEERRHFEEDVVTDELRLGGINDHDCWQYYWRRTMSRHGATVPDLAVLLRERFKDAELRILSLGSGYCGEDILLARRLAPCSVHCTDLNGALFEQARARVAAEGLALTFEEVDLNFIEIVPAQWHLIFAHASLHHLINLERLFDQVRAGLVPNGIFHVVEVTGQNRRLLWRDNERFARRLVRMLPFRLRGIARIQAPVHAEGMEGIRQQEILRLIHQRFTTIVEVQHGAFMRAVCLHRRLGPRLDPRDPERRRWLDWLIDADESAIRRGLLPPLELWGLYEAAERGSG